MKILIVLALLLSACASEGQADVAPTPPPMQYAAVVGFAGEGYIAYVAGRDRELLKLRYGTDVDGVYPVRGLPANGLMICRYHGIEVWSLPTESSRFVASEVCRQQATWKGSFSR